MIQVQNNFKLKNYNTFGFDVTCKSYISCNTFSELQKALNYLKEHPQPFFILGGGSNVLFSKDFDGLIIHPLMDKITIIKENSEHVWLEADAGVVWDQLVDHCVDKQWYGLENLSYIPGNVGASPVQNIGAYGIEAKDCIESVKGIYIDTLYEFLLMNEECQFAYRQSIFKNSLKNKVVISSVVFKLNKTEQFNLSYGPVKEQVELKGPITLKNVRETIIEIRKSKLPEPDETGNAGSFFKNPVIKQELFNQLQTEYKDIPYYAAGDNLVKVPAGWLIEHAGWRGKRLNQAAVHNKQALVLVNMGGATGHDILKLAEKIIVDVKGQFGISIEPEVNII